MSNRVYGLDIVRASAIMFVMVGHSLEFIPKDIAGKLAYLTLDGVSVFFVLSGFLIGTILLKWLGEGRSLINFWSRRWLRTIPNYYFWLIVLFIIGYLSNTLDHGLYNYFYFTQNFYHRSHDFFSESWSLSVEEWFYLSSPVIMILLVRFGVVKRKAFLYTAIFMLLFSTVFRTVRYFIADIHTIDEWNYMLRKQVVTTLDSIAFGLIGAYVNRFHKEVFIRYKNVLLIVGIAGAYAVRFTLYFNDLSFYYCVPYFSLLSFFILLTVPYFSSLKSGSGIIFKSVTFISLISYSLYLVNYSLVRNTILTSTFIKSGHFYLFWLLSFALAMFSYYCIEKPFMNLRS